MRLQIKKIIPATISIGTILFLSGVFIIIPFQSARGWERPITDAVTNQIVKAVDFTNPTTRDFAVKLATRYSWSVGEYNLGQVVSIYEYLYKNWKYVNDPAGIDYFSPASRTIELGLAGDCDDFAILMAAVIKAIGGSSRIIVAYGSEGNHAYAEVYMGTEDHAKNLISSLQKRYGNEVIHYHLRDDSAYLNLDWSARYPGGLFFDPTEEGEYSICLGCEVIRPLDVDLIEKRRPDVTPPINPGALAWSDAFARGVSPKRLNWWEKPITDTIINQNESNNDNSPHFEFWFGDHGKDSSGVAGYYVYFGQNKNADPLKNGTYQTNNPSSYTPTNITSDGNYYLIFIAKDNGGNLSNKATYTYKYRFSIVSSAQPIIKKHPDDTLIKTASVPTIYLVKNERKRSVPNVEVFNSLGYKWEDVVTVSQAEMDSYPLGPVVTISEGRVLSASDSNPTIPEGALIRAKGGIDIYIVKYVGSKKFKRLILSPLVFNNYGHLKWEDVIDIIEQSVVDSFTTSELVRAVGDEKVYKLYPVGDTGEKRWIKTGEAFTRMSFDWDAIYEINQFDRDSYVMGAPLE